jgi:hypothetical protein
MVGRDDVDLENHHQAHVQKQAMVSFTISQVKPIHQLINHP